MRLDAVCRLALFAVVRLVVCRLQLNAEIERQVVADDEQAQWPIFHGKERAARRFVDRRDGPLVSQSTTNHFRARVARERNHGVVAADNALREITGNVIRDAVLGEMRHAAALIPREEVLETCAVVDGAPHGRRDGVTVLLITRVLIHAIPEFLAGFLADEIAQKIHH